MRAKAWLAAAALVAGCGGDADSGARRAGADGAPTVAAIQGSGAASPYAGRDVTVSGIVAGDFQDGDADTGRDLGGFFLQSGSPDDDAATSDGLFVEDRGLAGPDVGVGDRVAVTGTVVEHFGETRLVAAALRITGSGTVRTAELSLPAATIARNGDGEALADLERYEGMRVRLAGPLYVQDLHTLERYGDLLLASEPRQWTYTSRQRPDAAGFAAWQEGLAAARLILDDGLARQNATPIPYLDPAAARRPPRVGDRVERLEGVLRYGRGSGSQGSEGWRLLPLVEPQFPAPQARPPRPSPGADLVVASFNVLNFFTTIDQGEAACGPRRDSACRGADTVAEFERQRAKTVQAIGALDAAIVGLMEIENGAATGTLVALLDAAEPGAAWRQVETGTVGDDAIRVALIYRSSLVAATGPFAVLDRQVDARFADDRNRPALAQTFRYLGNGGTFTVAVNHLKSKGSPCDDSGDPDRGDGQGNCNVTRTQAAAALADWLGGDPTGSGDPDFLVIGDLNAYRYEDPLQALEAAGLVNLLPRDGGDDTYTYVFRGASGALDHALASASFAAQVRTAAAWHANADEAPLLDYNLEFGRDPALFDGASPWRASDHDPLLIGITPDPD